QQSKNIRLILDSQSEMKDKMEQVASAISSAAVDNQCYFLPVFPPTKDITNYKMPQVISDVSVSSRKVQKHLKDLLEGKINSPEIARSGNALIPGALSRISSFDYKVFERMPE